MGTGAWLCERGGEGSETEVGCGSWLDRADITQCNKKHKLGLGWESSSVLDGVGPGQSQDPRPHVRFGCCIVRLRSCIFPRAG